jgi:hypothetical protein
MCPLFSIVSCHLLVTYCPCCVNVAVLVLEQNEEVVQED